MFRSESMLNMNFIICVQIKKYGHLEDNEGNLSKLGEYLTEGKRKSTYDKNREE